MNQQLKISKKEKSMQDLKVIFAQNVWLKWNHCLQRTKMLNIYYV